VRTKTETFFKVVLLLAVVGCTTGPDVPDDTLALIGDRSIKKEDFVRRYNDFRRRTGDGVPDTYEARKQILRLFVDEEVLVNEAEHEGIGQDAAGRLERQRIEIQQLLNLFNRSVVAPTVKVSEAEVKALFVRLNTRLKAHHLYAASKEEAQVMYASLQSGMSFEELAKKTFKDKRLKNSGGLLGYFSVDEMEPSFENVAYSLDIGEISKPVKTSDGYSIIRVDDRVTKPLLTETEYAKHKHKLYSYWKNRKIKEAIRAFADSIGQSLDISFDASNVTKLYEVITSNPPGSTVGEGFHVPMELAEAHLVESKLGTWKMTDFQEKARFTSSAHVDRIRNVEQFQEFISGLVIRERILGVARAAGLDEKPEYKKKVAEKWDTYLLTRMEARLAKEMTVPKDSVLSYYRHHSEKFAEPPSINLREIVLPSKETAEGVRQQLSQGRPFPELAREYSIRKWSAKRGGELGFLTEPDLGKWAKKIFEMQVGESRGPVRMDSMYVFLECIDKRPMKRRNLEEVWAEVEEAVRYAMKDDYRAARLTELRKREDHLVVLSSRLKDIRLTAELAR